MTITEHQSTTTVASRVAGEDLVVGQFVTVLNEIIELPSFLWNCSDVSLPPDECVRLRMVPTEAGEPFKVAAVCLPFVYARRPKGGLMTFDVRKHELVRLDQDVASELWLIKRGKRRSKKASASKGKKSRK